MWGIHGKKNPNSFSFYHLISCQLAQSNQKPESREKSRKVYIVELEEQMEAITPLNLGTVPEWNIYFSTSVDWIYYPMFQSCSSALNSRKNSDKTKSLIITCNISWFFIYSIALFSSQKVFISISNPFLQNKLRSTKTKGLAYNTKVIAKGDYIPWQISILWYYKVL